MSMEFLNELSGPLEVLVWVVLVGLAAVLGVLIGGWTLSLCFLISTHRKMRKEEKDEPLPRLYARGPLR